VSPGIWFPEQRLTPSGGKQVFRAASSCAHATGRKIYDAAWHPCVRPIGPRISVLVVDNDPSDDRTARLSKGFPVRYVLEPRRGLNWARTRGAEEASGEIVVFIDDDAISGNGWLDAILEPFANPEVAAVTGLVMPAELEYDAQEQFERYCGFARGFRRREYTRGDDLAAGSGKRRGGGLHGDPEIPCQRPRTVPRGTGLRHRDTFGRGHLRVLSVAFPGVPHRL